MTRHSFRGPAIGFGLGVLLCALPLSAGDKITWKSVETAVLKLDERAAKHWEVFVTEKKHHLVLVQLGAQYLLIDFNARALFDVPAESFEHKGKDFRMLFPEHKGKLVATDQWSIRDAGRARIIRMRLLDELHVLEVQLPLQPDLRYLY